MHVAEDHTLSSEATPIMHVAEDHALSSEATPIMHVAEETCRGPRPLK